MAFFQTRSSVVEWFTLPKGLTHRFFLSSFSTPDLFHAGSIQQITLGRETQSIAYVLLLTGRSSKEPCREVWIWELPEHRNKICSKVCGARKQSPFSACPGEHHPSDMRPEYMGDTIQCFRTSWNHNALSETMYHTHVHQNGHSPASHSDSERESFYDFPCSTVRYPFSGGNVSM